MAVALLLFLMKNQLMLLSKTYSRSLFNADKNVQKMSLMVFNLNAIVTRYNRLPSGSPTIGNTISF